MIPAIETDPAFPQNTNCGVSGSKSSKDLKLKAPRVPVASKNRLSKLVRSKIAWVPNTQPPTV